MKILAQRIKSRRIEKNMQQKKLAEIIGVKESTISSYEIDNSSPDVEKLKKIALALGTTSDYLLGLSESKVGDNLADDTKMIIDEIESNKLSMDDIKYIISLKKAFRTLPDVEVMNKIKANLNISTEEFLKLKEFSNNKIPLEEIKEMIKKWKDS